MGQYRPRKRVGSTLDPGAARVDPVAYAPGTDSCRKSLGPTPRLGVSAVKCFQTMHDTNLLEDQPIAWTPTPDVIERAQLTRFMKQVGISTWDELYEFSIRDVEKFTEEVLKFLDIKFDPPYSRLLDTSGGVEFPQWLISPPRRGDAEDERQETGDGGQ